MVALCLLVRSVNGEHWLQYFRPRAVLGCDERAAARPERKDDRMQRASPADDERQLVERARRDRDAFRELYQRYFPRVYAYIAYRVGRRQDAEDLTADVFLRALNGLVRFEDRGPGAFAAWLFRIAHNLVQESYRRRGTAPEALPLDQLPDLAGHALLPEEALLRKEQFAVLRCLVGTLSPRGREVVLLKFFGELRNREIATLLGLDERTVGAYLSRALQELNRKYRRESAIDAEGGLSDELQGAARRRCRIA